jgi:hypothetical protein
MHWASMHNQFNNATDHETACRAYAALFYESATACQGQPACVVDAENDQEIAAPDSEINA